MLFNIWSVVFFCSSTWPHPQGPAVWLQQQEQLQGKILSTNTACARFFSASKTRESREKCTVASHSDSEVRTFSCGGLSWDGCWSYVISFLWAYQNPSLFLTSCILKHFPLSIPISSWALKFIPSCQSLYSSVHFYLCYPLQVPSLTPKIETLEVEVSCLWIYHTLLWQDMWKSTLLKSHEHWCSLISHTNTTLQMWCAGASNYR